MAKVAITTAKYIIYAKIDAEGVVEKPDVVGAIFGQTEGLLGDELELRELQRNGRIGRIEAKISSSNGKSFGVIEVPSSLNKEEPAVIAAALETIDRVGPCKAEVKVERVEDVRTSKRKFLVDRAKDILKTMLVETIPESQEISDLVRKEVRVKAVVNYGTEKLAAGPNVDSSDAIIVAEGRADVINLLKGGIKNVIAIGGTSIPKTIIALTKTKTVTAFLDGDRGGDLILKELMQVCDIDFVARAPLGKEVEELTQKEIILSLRSKIAGEQALSEIKARASAPPAQQKRVVTPSRPITRVVRKTGLPKELEQFKPFMDKVRDKHTALLLDDKLGGIADFPTRELPKVFKDLRTKVHSIVLDASVSQDLVNMAKEKNISIIVGTSKNRGLKYPSNMRVYSLQ